jgi:hypothetical protein
MASESDGLSDSNYRALMATRKTTQTIGPQGLHGQGSATVTESGRPGRSESSGLVGPGARRAGWPWRTNGRPDLGRD